MRFLATIAAIVILVGISEKQPIWAAAQTAKLGKPNRLINEPSPYLQQHAHNPVDWFPWGKEAFDKAKRENKPIFLSVGYSTCHWCHVMEKESFSNPDIAALMNKHFVSIKVDRERRPDVDKTYMLATQIITKSSGWPNNVFMTPDLKPFHAAIYLPPKELKSLSQTIAEGWQNGTAILKHRAERLSNLIRTYMQDGTAARQATPIALAKASKDLITDFDEFYGGFGTAPKFPLETRLLFLLDQAARQQDSQILKVVTTTLDAMLDGAIHDHVGGGFHRYATDNEWRVPHFEKMLYNQALMSMTLTEAWRLTGNERYRNAANRTLKYAIDQMRHPKGGFISAYDADSLDGEGTYYTYTFQELRTALGKDLPIANKLFSISDAGNFDGRNIIFFSQPKSDLLASLNLSSKQFDEAVSRIRKKLGALRTRRQSPHRDNKVLVSWNGLMMMALVDAAQAYNRRDYANYATQIAQFIWINMGGKDRNLKRIWFAEKSDLPATQTDIAMFALGLVTLADMPDMDIWLDRAKSLAEQMEQTFRDPKAGDFFLTASADTFVRPKFRADSQIPSGNAIALELFARLAKRDAAPKHDQRANRLLGSLVATALSAPDGGSYTLRAADRFLQGPVGAYRSLAKGKVKAHIKRGKRPNTIEVTLDIAPGWHINANKPLEDFFIPTEVSADGILQAGTTRYPPAIRRSLGFHDKELALYEGRVKITAKLDDLKIKREKIQVGGPAVSLSLQSCSDKVCLAPEQITLMLPVRH